MGRYWLDTDVLIQAKNNWYTFEIARQFWDFLEEQAEAEIVCSSTRVYGEIMRYEGKDDPLVKWAKLRKNSRLFCAPDKDVQIFCGEVGDYALKNYDYRLPAVKKFLDGADPWTIAHAKCDRGTVVSHESLLDRNAKKPKIPNVCHAFRVGCINLPAMLKALRFKFGK